jgi:hypothetical protein
VKFAAVPSIAQGIAFDSIAIKTCMDALGVNGLPLSTDADETALIFYGRPLSDGGIVASAGSLKYTVRKGCAYPVRLSMNHGAPAMLSCAVVPVEESASYNPIILTASQTEAITVPAYEGYTLGRMVVNGNEVDSVQSINVDFGLTIGTVMTGGSPYPRAVHVLGIAPRITVNTLDFDWVNTLTLDGLAYASSTYIVAHQLTANGTLTAAATAAHLRFTAYDGIFVWRGQQAAGNGMIGHAFELVPVKNSGQTYNLVYASGQAA